VHGHQGATEVRWIEQQTKTSLFDDLHQVHAPSSITDPPLPGGHARGWAGARHLR
jgi:hypothetical protein